MKLKNKKIYILALLIGAACLSLYFFSTYKCNQLKKLGFDYEIKGGASPTWDIVVFFYRAPDDRKIDGPEISGSLLKVYCDDVDSDGTLEFIIQSKVDEDYRTVLKMDLKTGYYHVFKTKGLNIFYPREGYNVL